MLWTCSQISVETSGKSNLSGVFRLYYWSFEQNFYFSSSSRVSEIMLKNIQDALIEKLEKDLLSVNALPSAYRTGGDGASATPSIQHEFLENALKA